MNEQFNREIEILKKKQIEMLEMKSSIVRLRPGVVAHACSPSTLGGRDRRIRVCGQPQLSLSLSLSVSLST